MDKSMESGKRKKFWKVYKIIMLAVLIAVIVVDIICWSIYKINTVRHNSQLDEARAYGYQSEYMICSRQEDVIIDGTRYKQFNAHREAILDGDYNEDLIVRSDSEYKDEVPDQTTNLIIYANESNDYYDDKNVKTYTFIDIYSICNYTDDDSEIAIWISLLFTIFNVFIEVLLVLVFIIHKCVECVKCSNFLKK